MPSIQQYKKLLSIAEALLRKVDMPDQTLNKYQALKQKILSDYDYPTMTTTEPEHLRGEVAALNIESRIKDEIIEVYFNLTRTAGEVLRSFLTSEDIETPKLSNKESLTAFYEDFNERKNMIRDIVVDSDVNANVKQSLKSYIQEVDNMSIHFDQFLEIIAAVQKNFFDNFELEKNLKERAMMADGRIEELEQNLKLKDEQLSIYKDLQEENSDLKDEIENLQRISELANENCRNLDDQLRIMNEQSEMVSEKIDNFFKIFSGYCNDYRDYYEGELDQGDFEEVVNFVDLLIKKLVVDSKEILVKNEDLQIKLQEVEQEVSTRRQNTEENIKLFGEFGMILKQNEKSYNELEVLERSFVNIIQGPVAIRSLKLGQSN